MFRKFFFRRPSFANSLILQFGLLMLLALAVFAAGSYRLIVAPVGDTVNKTESPSQNVNGPDATIVADEGIGSMLTVYDADAVHPLAPVTVTCRCRK